MEPSKGRIVTYHCTDGERYLGCGDDMTLPAIIVGIIPGVMKGVNLVVFANSTAMLTLRTAVPFGLTNGGWTWPEGSIESHGLVPTSAHHPAENIYNKDTEIDALPPSICSPASEIQPPSHLTMVSTQPPRLPKVG